MENDSKEEFTLTRENYHTPEARKRYMGNSLYKKFKQCEVMGLALAEGTYEEKSTPALLVGSYIDAYFSGELDQFTTEHPEIFTKQGILKADFKLAEDVIKAIEEDDYFMKYIGGGDKQVIMTGEIAGVPWKIMIDNYFEGKLILDRKVMKDMENVWVEINGRNVLLDFVQAYGYDIQGACYQEVVRQNTGLKLPFVLGVATKQECPDKKLIKIEQEYLDEALEDIKAHAPRYWDIIQGKVAPKGCGHCPACRARNKVKGVESYRKLFREKEE